MHEGKDGVMKRPLSHLTFVTAKQASNHARGEIDSDDLGPLSSPPLSRRCSKQHINIQNSGSVVGDSICSSVVARLQAASYVYTLFSVQGEVLTGDLQS